MLPLKLAALLLTFILSLSAAPLTGVTEVDEQGREVCPPLRRPGQATIIVPVGFEVESDCGMCVCTRENGLVCKGCEDCSFHGTTYRHQQTWWNDCNECQCDNSTITCREKSCPGTCEYHGETKFIGEQWEDDCNTCTCTEEGTTCTETKCYCDFDGVRRIHQERWEQNTGEWCTCLSGTTIGFACMFQEANALNNLLDSFDMPDFG